jgi:hypothetical protein
MAESAAAADRSSLAAKLENQVKVNEALRKQVEALEAANKTLLTASQIDAAAGYAVALRVPKVSGGGVVLPAGTVIGHFHATGLPQMGGQSLPPDHCEVLIRSHKTEWKAIA